MRQTSKKRVVTEGVSCRTFLLICWILVMSWLFFLFFVWKSGISNSNAITRIVAVTPGGETSSLVNGNPLSQKIPTLSLADEDSDMHVIFSTDCSSYQDWQTIVLFHSAMAVGQKGPVTRIASGCDELKKVALTTLYKKLFPLYHVHFTPDFSRDEKTNSLYHFYNKPWGVRHWIAHAEPKVSDSVVVALIDPDMIFLRPLTSKIRGQPNNIISKDMNDADLVDKIKLGYPVSQMYGLGAPWTNDTHLKFNRTKICGVGSPCLETKRKFGDEHYAVGPPYIMVKADMRRLSRSWTEFVRRVFDGYPHLLAEMYAYSMAAAHEKLPHLQMQNYMVSNTDSYGEGWIFIDRLKDPCAPSVDGIYQPNELLPNLLHYCQNFRAGTYGFAKRQVPSQIFDCDHPLFVEPPRNLASVNFRMMRGKKQELGPIQAQRNAFQLNVIHRSINAAIVHYKENICDTSRKINYKKSYSVLPATRRI